VSGPVSASEFSSLFNSSSASTEVMFMTGDKSVFLITTLDQLRNTSSSTQRVRARSSSLSPKPRLSFHSLSLDDFQTLSSSSTAAGPITQIPLFP
jgi:hypothetical protein